MQAVPQDQLNQMFGLLNSAAMQVDPVGERSWQDQNSRPSKLARLPNGTGWGGKGGHKGGNKRARQLQMQPQSMQAVPDMHCEMEELVAMLTKLVLRQEDSISVLRQNSAFILWLQTPKHPCSVVKQLVAAAGQWKREADKATAVGRVPLRCVLLQGLVAILMDRIAVPEQQAAAQKAGWFTGQAWVFQEWSPEEQKLRVCENKTPIPHAEMMTKLASLQKSLAEDRIIHRFKSLRPLQEQMQGETVAMILDLAIADKDAMDAQQMLVNLMGNAVFQIVGMHYRREGLGRSQLAKSIQKILNNFVL